MIIVVGLFLFSFVFFCFFKEKLPDSPRKGLLEWLPEAEGAALQRWAGAGGVAAASCASAWLGAPNRLDDGTAGVGADQLTAGVGSADADVNKASYARHSNSPNSFFFVQDSVKVKRNWNGRRIIGQAYRCLKEEPSLLQGHFMKCDSIKESPKRKSVK